MVRAPGFGVSADLAVATAGPRSERSGRRGRLAKWLTAGRAVGLADQYHDGDLLHLGRRREMTDAVEEQVFVPVVEVRSGREIGWGTNVSESLRARVPDIHAAIQAGAESIAASLGSLPTVQQWSASEVSASFGITLAAEAGVILSKASTEATFEVTITFNRK
jgi:Trypsin-co-occurring domain 1